MQEVYRVKYTTREGEEVGMGPQDHRDVMNAATEARAYTAEHPEFVGSVVEQTSGRVQNRYALGRVLTSAANL